MQNNKFTKAKLYLKNGETLEAKNFGSIKSVAGEVVFATGMTGYPEALTDPSFKGQILVFTYPIIGSYGVPKKEFWESDKIQVSGLIVSQYIDTPSHHENASTLAQWFKKENIPLLEIKDTRLLTQKLRDKGAMLGKIICKKDIPYQDPNKENLVAEVSTKKIFSVGTGKKNIVLIDCGTKKNIAESVAKRGVKVTVVPWDTDPTSLSFTPDAVIISNGPGDPTKATATIKNVKKLLQKHIPILGICLGNQILNLASGGKTYKLKFGHRSQNQPVLEVGTDKCYLTTQNHGFAVGTIPKNFKEWFRNANDDTNEGIIHQSLPFMSVQFHPESTPGPTDTDWIFDYFLKRANIL
ncbi:MAG: glutamine-hydrolyzing carbamoyl-phosphate synthase small subunit [Candidatus Pacebacteria bacterium]|nr:glutamine-hydrolyzing carbamoyl-phosphate synthase small subunit [Candidatus Paceibacterota bacterium]MCF7862880.1 glutamine-hydrolyzing carbamoyl-phosphate synthase small subunit [Candidatus Paceibacterota bacterium]